MKRTRPHLGTLLVASLLGSLIPIGIIPAAAATVVINEVDSNTPSPTDGAEFVELYDGGVGNTLLDGLVLVFYSHEGLFDLTYGSVDLDGATTDANGYVVICGSVDAVFASSCDIDAPIVFRNGSAAVALYQGNGADFPGNRAIHTNGLLDAMVYGTPDPDPDFVLGLLALLNPGQPQVDEGASGDVESASNQRCPDGSGGTRNTNTFAPFAPTVGAVNGCGSSPSTPTTTTTSTTTTSTTTTSTTSTSTTTTTTMPPTTTTTSAPPGNPGQAPGSDRKAPHVSAELDRISVEHNRGWFRVDFRCRDRVDRRPTCVGYLNGTEVRDGQKVQLIRSPGAPSTTMKGHVLVIKDVSFLLTVIGTDRSGNSATATAPPSFRHRGSIRRCW